MRFGMHIRIAALIVLSIGAVPPYFAGEEESASRRYNIVCPATRLCPDLEKYYQACKSENEPNVCNSFVATFRKLAGKYDCQRSFDHTPTADYIVPAVWVCREGLNIGETRSIFEEYIVFLQKLNSGEARCFFASPEFRGILDGEYAELFYEKSLSAEKTIKDLRCPPPEEADKSMPESENR